MTNFLTLAFVNFFESSAVEHESGESLLKLVPVKSTNEDEEQGLTYTTNMHEAEIHLKEVYTNKMSVCIFIEGWYA